MPYQLGDRPSRSVIFGLRPTISTIRAQIPSSSNRRAADRASVWRFQTPNTAEPLPVINAPQRAQPAQSFLERSNAGIDPHRRFFKIVDEKIFRGRVPRNRNADST